MEIRELDLVGPIVAVHAHPDDETLSSGGLLALAAERGFGVTLVTCTRGEQGEVIGNDPDGLEGNGPALGAYRERELARAMAALGVRDHVFLDQLVPVPGDESVPLDAAVTVSEVRFCDSGMSWVDGELGAGVSGAAQPPDEVSPDAFYFADIEASASRLAGVLLKRAARTVVTYEPGGGYGHPDHIRAAQVARRAVELAQDGGAGPIRMLSSVIPADIARSGRAALHDLAARGLVAGTDHGGVIPEVSAPLAAVSAHEDATAYTLDTRDYLPQVLAAMREHATQIQWACELPAYGIAAGAAVIGSYALSNDIISPLFSHEFYAELL
ncbi:PIG-L family deacetylase [Populibacterium corticicola]|uniref:PIG-L family deacetylase n=1 Tax=Populibacterium corticicola TaxID=1812826 RepID=A0ABW5XEY1_9MICO